MSSPATPRSRGGSRARSRRRRSRRRWPGCAAGWRPRASRPAATRSATSPGAAATGTPLIIGSHLDSVADAGRYDGILGVLIGLEVAEADDGPLEVVAFADEEGLRFQSTFLGSRAFIGRLEPDELALTDPDGVTLGDAIGGDARRAALRTAPAPTSRSTSSRARCSRPRACRSAS